MDREQAENARNLAESARLNGEAYANGAFDSSEHHRNNGEVEKGTLEGNLSEKETLDSLSVKISCDETSNSVLKQR